MSDIRNEVRRKIAFQIGRCLEDPNVLTESISEILSISELALVDREAELPNTELNSDEREELNQTIKEEMSENWRLCGRRPPAEFAAQRLAVLTTRKQNTNTQDILKAGWVKEVKE